MGALDDLVVLYDKAAESGYIMLPDDFTALGYLAMGADDYRRVLFIVEQSNGAIEFLNHTDGIRATYWQMAKYQDGTYGIR